MTLWQRDVVHVAEPRRTRRRLPRPVLTAVAAVVAVDVVVLMADLLL